MPEYYVNRIQQTNGYHEVHTSDCSFIPDESCRKNLGNFSTCLPAVKEAKKIYPLAIGCIFCSRSCHSRHKEFSVE